MLNYQKELKKKVIFLRLSHFSTKILLAEVYIWLYSRFSALLSKMKKLLSLLTSLILLIIPMWEIFGQQEKSYGAVIRGNREVKKISLVFTGHEHAEGADEILSVLKKKDLYGAFFLTGDFFRNPDFESKISALINEGHYIGPHSDKHLLYCSWEDRSQLLVDKETFLLDLKNNYREMEKYGVGIGQSPYFMPPYEWYNDSISHWAGEFGVQLINFTPGIRSHADYTEPEMANYIGSNAIMESIWKYERNAFHGMNGFILLSHIGVGDKRQDKFFNQLIHLIEGLEARGYQIVPLKELLEIK
jgi:peptidoglycan/xylan/chitin deacetylase (PgdA/CDA1 family)